ncbi:alpha/beta fold hydrolase [Streptomyces lancefieldiae]|uniref:Alpha/beta hydrolase n=1 Tax=Streptomyces lancefieldiae TaxID=3075520 RepID=A0ABU3ALV8_9ACTN|nr:alpha/beta hydrolase [Streptomyces sp. DSM 40712]MDT0611182.1 alpha/beta hydrolase [Streptomyces sp. DSM 40712]
MTVFILVSGMFTGTHIWRDTAARLTAAGTEAHAVPLTGLDGPRTATAGIDLETHIADVLAVIDSVGTAADRRIVLVGHDYGIHPALGAADRRAGRVERIVYLDSGMPRDGAPALAAVPDQSLRERLAGRAGPGGEVADGVLPPPGRDEWRLWGSTAGIPGPALDRLTALAAPQPLGTLLQSLRLTGAVASVPTTGVLCTGNGASIEMVQMLVGFGDPALRALVDPRVTFFELPTGHWPMLSCPAELTDVLLRAAAGEGHRLEPVDAAAPPAHLRPFLLEVPDVPRERHGNVDLYLPDAQEPRPAVVFVHGGPVPADARPTPRDWPVLRGYARYAAGGGAVGAVLDHRLHDLADYARAAADVAAAVERVRADPRVDEDRIALWFFSGGGPIAADWLEAPPAWLRCLAASYPVLAPLPNWGLSGTRFHPARAVANAGALPLVLTRAGLEMPEIAATVEEFLTEAENCGAHVEVVDVPHGHHAFESVDPTDESREAVRRAMRSVLSLVGDGVAHRDDAWRAAV